MEETKEIRCTKDRGGKGEMITCSYKKKASSIYLHPDSVILDNLKCGKEDFGGSTKCELKNPKEFRAGDMWSNDFDYCGMLDLGKSAKVSDKIEFLNRLFDSYEDVNYHRESGPLFEAINLLKKGKKELAEEKLKEFNRLSEETQKEIC